ncbi:hypothetical protein EBI_25882 [Enterocytozoon bieneusi H348]|nr:hypothetical protein EBI_25882 [Enterocytozoon bieneusi H348]|eukprot:XP_001828009.1 hypothetical protein EBI_25882 [Enterocytozoon bieneusi H348]
MFNKNYYYWLLKIIKQIKLKKIHYMNNKCKILGKEYLDQKGTCQLYNTNDNLFAKVSSESFDEKKKFIDDILTNYENEYKIIIRCINSQIPYCVRQYILITKALEKYFSNKQFEKKQYQSTTNIAVIKLEKKDFILHKYNNLSSESISKIKNNNK